MLFSNFHRFGVGGSGTFEPGTQYALQSLVRADAHAHQRVSVLACEVDEERELAQRLVRLHPTQIDRVDIVPRLLGEGDNLRRDRFLDLGWSSKRRFELGPKVISLTFGQVIAGWSGADLPTIDSFDTGERVLHFTQLTRLLHNLA